MKALCMLAMLLLAVSIGNAQTPLDPPSITTQNAMLKAHPLVYPDTISFKDTSVFDPVYGGFMLGHQWYNALAGVNKRLYMNYYTANDGALFGLYAANFYRYPRSYTKKSYIGYDIRGSVLGYCFSLQIDPEAPLDENGVFTPAVGDTLGAIFGFQYKDGGSRGTATNTNRYVYLSDSGRVDTGRLILSHPVSTNYLRRMTGTGENESDVHTNGTRWYLSVNLRRLDALWDDTTNTSDTVLSIKIPIRYNITVTVPDDTGSGTHQVIIPAYRQIKFDSINSSSYRGYYTRGGWMDQHLMLDTADRDSVFVIRRSMLPKFSDTCDITLSTDFIVADPGDTSIHNKVNPPFPASPSDIAIGEIDSIGMEVRYYGKCNIAIDWIRLETPKTRALFRGERDSAIAGLVSHGFTKMKAFQSISDWQAGYIVLLPRVGQTGLQP